MTRTHQPVSVEAVATAIAATNLALLATQIPVGLGLVMWAATTVSVGCIAVQMWRLRSQIQLLAVVATVDSGRSWDTHVRQAIDLFTTSKEGEMS